MSDEIRPNRRQVLAGIGIAAIAGGVGYYTLTSGEWTVAETPVDVTLHDVAVTAAGYYAVGDNGVVLKRGKQGWTKVTDTGPAGDSRDLYGAGVTADGKRLWFVGASGAIGEYDVSSGTLTDHSSPNDNTNNYNAVAVTGTAGKANLYVADAAGHIHYSFENGEAQTWHSVTPGSGAELPAIDFHAARAGHAVDTNGAVFATDDGKTWSKIGMEDANVNFYGVDSDAPDDVDVSGGNGMVFHYDGSQWTKSELGDAQLTDIERRKNTGFTVGGGGTVFEYSNGKWQSDDVPIGDNLNAVALGKPVVAVGDGGTVIEQTG